MPGKMSVSEKILDQVYNRSWNKVAKNFDIHLLSNIYSTVKVSIREKICIQVCDNILDQVNENKKYFNRS